MFKTLIIAFIGIGIISNAYSFDIGLLANNKESESKLIGFDEKIQINHWQKRFSDREQLNC